MTAEADEPAGGAHKLILFEGVTFLLGLSLLLLAWLPAIYWPQSGAYTVLQLLRSAVAGAVVVVGVRGYAEHGSFRLLLMGLAFLCFGILDLFHSLAAPGEPSFPFGADEDLSLWFWQVSRLIGALLLLSSVLMPTGGMVQPTTRRDAFLYVVATVVVLGMIVALLVVDTSLPSLWHPEEGLTDLKRWLEILAIAIYTLVSLAYLRLWQRRRQDVLLVFALGMLGLAFAGIALNAQRSFYDLSFWLADAYKLFAYLCFGAGVWSLSRPARGT